MLQQGQIDCMVWYLSYKREELIYFLDIQFNLQFSKMFLRTLRCTLIIYLLALFQHFVLRAETILFKEHNNSLIALNFIFKRSHGCILHATIGFITKLKRFFQHLSKILRDKLKMSHYCK